MIGVNVTEIAQVAVGTTDAQLLALTANAPVNDPIIVGVERSNTAVPVLVMVSVRAVLVVPTDCKPKPKKVALAMKAGVGTTGVTVTVFEDALRPIALVAVTEQE